MKQFRTLRILVVLSIFYGCSDTQSPDEITYIINSQELITGKKVKQPKEVNEFFLEKKLIDSVIIPSHQSLLPIKIFGNGHQSIARFQYRAEFKKYLTSKKTTKPVKSFKLFIYEVKHVNTQERGTTNTSHNSLPITETPLTEDEYLWAQAYLIGSQCLGNFNKFSSDGNLFHLKRETDTIPVTAYCEWFPQSRLWVLYGFDLDPYMANSFVFIKK